jgi:zinc transport system ATP-binding protein
VPDTPPLLPDTPLLPDPEPLVSIRNVSFRYGETPALESVSLDIHRKTTLGLIGPNGGGKTTLLRLLLGQFKPDSGDIRIAGLSPPAAVRKGNLIGYLAQHGHEVTRLPISVRDAVRLGLVGKSGLMTPPSRDDLDFAERLMLRVGLDNLQSKPLRDLSGGQIQRAYIARAVVARPALLLLDEPTTGIDRANQERLLETISQLKHELDLTVVLVSHDLRAVTRVADRIACLNSTLHYHDIPSGFPEDLARGMFCCDLEAMGISCTHKHPHPHLHPLSHLHPSPLSPPTPPAPGPLVEVLP